ncbi:hypothetical protein BaRGS_00037496 [Batillaria attramentaria]|uniref:carbonic anhydrase n=1 Tax=Batillaria attramentaria TaxID=370345 RepID=A0ABD0J8Z2_9CAEN
MHVVAYNCKYGDMATAVGHSDGLAVLGFFFEISSKDNKGFKRIVHALGKITNPGTVYGMKPVPLMDLFPSDVNNYYRYAGGLTTPPCSEVVTWTVFRQPIPISAKQMEAFRNLKSREVDASGSLIALQDNYRPVQPLGGRSIRVNFKASQ